MYNSKYAKRIISFISAYLHFLLITREKVKINI